MPPRVLPPRFSSPRVKNADLKRQRRGGHRRGVAREHVRPVACARSTRTTGNAEQLLSQWSAVHVAAGAFVSSARRRSRDSRFRRLAPIIYIYTENALCADRVRDRILLVHHHLHGRTARHACLAGSLFSAPRTGHGKPLPRRKPGVCTRLDGSRTGCQPRPAQTRQMDAGLTGASCSHHQ